MKSNTKSAAAYRTKEEAFEQYFKCLDKCVEDHRDNNKELHNACIMKCKESDWSFEQDVKFSEQLTSIMDKLNDGFSDLSVMLEDLNLMGL